MLRSRVDSSLMIGGLRPRATAALDTVHLPRGATRELWFRLNTPGTYFYWGALAGSGFEDRLWYDSQLNGAIVVDPPGGPTRPSVRHQRVVSPLSENDRPFESASLINGKAWPHTERLTLALGDSARSG